jgi:SAM-dependent methyltransferase
MLQAVYNELASIEERHWWFRARRDIFAAVIQKYAPPALARRLRLIEVGCGSGGNLPMLSRFGTVVGAEPEPTAIAYFLEKQGQAFTVLHHRVPEPLPDRYDILGMFDVLEHIEDDAGALKWAADQLEPGGILVLAVPAFKFLWTEQDEAALHFRRYTPRQLLDILPPSLSVIHRSCFNTLLFPAILAVRGVMRKKAPPDRPPKLHLGIPPEPFNWLLYQIFRLERFVVPRWRLNLGVSILLVARRPPR